LAIHGKTDNTDSSAIAHCLQKGDLTEYSHSPTRDCCKPLLSSIVLLDKQIRQTKNSLHAIDLYPDTPFIAEELKGTYK